jgi:hypothetical protein
MLGDARFAGRLDRSRRSAPLATAGHPGRETSSLSGSVRLRAGPHEHALCPQNPSIHRAFIAISSEILYQASIAFLPRDSFLHPKAWPTLILLPLVVGLFGAMVFAQVYGYRRISGPVERQQTKWVVFGLAAAMPLALAAVLPINAFQSSASKVLYMLSEALVFNCALLLVPLTIGIAILRYRLWDIDLLINRTLVYGTLTAILLLVYYTVPLC